MLAASKLLYSETVQTVQVDHIVQTVHVIQTVQTGHIVVTIDYQLFDVAHTAHTLYHVSNVMVSRRNLYIGHVLYVC